MYFRSVTVEGVSLGSPARIRTWISGTWEMGVLPLDDRGISPMESPSQAKRLNLMGFLIIDSLYTKIVISNQVDKSQK